MKKYILILTLLAFLISCSSTKNYSGKTGIDVTLQNTVQVLNKNPEDKKARQELPGLYADLQQVHLSNIKKFKAKNKDRSPYWMDIISEYQFLQNAYNSISNSVATHSIVAPVNYELSVTQIKEEAAKHYYQSGESLLGKNGKLNAQKALEAFTLCNYYVPGYERVRSNLDIAYARAVTNIIINPIKDHSQYGDLKADSGKKESASFGDLFREDLKANLHKDFLNSINPVAFYTDKEAAANNTRPDLVISLDLRAMDIALSLSSVINNTPPAPGGYVAENIVTYNPPVDGVGVGPQPLHPESFGNNDVFTYPPVPYAVYSVDQTRNNNNFILKGVLSLVIIDKNLRQNISSEILTKSVQLSEYPNQSAEPIVIDRKVFQELFGEFYLQIRDAVSTALN